MRAKFLGLLKVDTPPSNLCNVIVFRILRDNSFARISDEDWGKLFVT